MGFRRPDPPDVEMAFGKERDAPRRARRAIKSLVGDKGDPIAYAVNLVTSELVTNVVQHTTAGGTMRAWDPKTQIPLHLEVEDKDPTVPTPSVPKLDGSGGRGVTIVGTVADDWGVEPTPGGKIVWAEFDRNLHPVESP